MVAARSACGSQIGEIDVAKVITVFNQKGGAGKTTTSIQLAGTLARHKLKVLVVDMDPQQTSTQWKGCDETGRGLLADVIGLAPLGNKVYREIQKQSEKYDVILIDCPPEGDSPAAASSLMVSDLAIIPMPPAPVDIWATTLAKAAAKAAMVRNPDLQSRVLLVSYVRGTTLANEVESLLATDEDVPLMASRLARRVAYQECQMMGATVHALPRAGAAIAEVEALALEVAGLLKMDLPEVELPAATFEDEVQ